MSYLIVVVACSLFPLAIRCGHSCNSCTLGCTGSTRKPALEAFSASMALLVLVLVPWRVIHVHECVGVSKSSDDGVYVGMG